MTIVKKQLIVLSFTCLAYNFALFANLATDSIVETPFESYPQGWFVDLSGNYGLTSLTTPPTYSGSTTGFATKITHEKSDCLFNQLRIHYDVDRLKSSQNSVKTHDWRTEAVAGHSFSIKNRWSITPYLGVGIDWLKAEHSAYSSTPSIKLTYETQYALIGCKTSYKVQKWSFGSQIDLLPVLRQYLRVNSLSWSSWRLKQNVGVNVELPVGYLLKDNAYLEVTPYYRWFPIGSSSELGLPQRNLTRSGAFLTLRYFL